MSPLWGNVITAIGVLAGAGLAGTLALLKGRQDASVRIADREEDRRSQRVEHRRGAYAAFLTQARLVTTSLSVCASLETPVEQAEWIEASDSLDEAISGFYDVFVELALAGPPSLAEEAETLWLKAYRAHTQIERLWDRMDHGDAGRQLDSFLGDEEESRLNDFISQQKRFIMLARKQLGGDREE
ncbi:hypothetical protein [Streptomyces sp. NPDC055210]